MQEIKEALKGQYHAGLGMLRQTIDRCPEDLWLSGTHPRNYWRIAMHAIFYTHLYAQVNEEAYQPWEKFRDCTDLWGEENGEEPEVLEPFSKAEMLEYLDMVDGKIEEWVDKIDLSSPDTGFHWYKRMNKLDHQIMNIRHIQGHVGQLSELLMARGIDIDWMGKRSSAREEVAR